MVCVIVKRRGDLLEELIGPFDAMSEAREFKRVLMAAVGATEFRYTVVPLLSPVDAAPPPIPRGPAVT